MLIYKQRYKPRTAREFTGTAIDVYDSAGNTALNALAVYGKSEVVAGSIVSAGEGGSIEIETCGKNLFDPTQLNVSSPNWQYLTVTLKPNTTYTMSTPDLPSNTSQDIYPELYFMVGEEGADILKKVYINHSITKTSGANGKFKIQYRSRDNTDDPITNYSFMLVEGSTATAYEPYNGTMATFATGTPLRGIPDTTVRDVMEWDGTSGEVTKNYGEIDLGTPTWYYSTDYHSFTARITDMAIGTYSIAGNILCANYQTKSHQALDRESTGIAVSNNTNVVIIKDPAYTDAETFKTAMNGVMLVYELATPTTEQLTSTENASIAALRAFAPNTHAQNNAGTDMTVDYTIRVPTV